MTIFQELADVYDRNAHLAGQFTDGNSNLTLLPMAHVSVNIPVEVQLNEKLDVISVRFLDKKDQVTVIPATIQAANRSSAPAAFPLQDKVKYVAADYAQYAKDREKAAAYHNQYVTVLDEWADSDEAPAQVKLLAQYIHRGHVLESIKPFVSEKEWQTLITGEPFIRFNIANDTEVPMWRDLALFKAWSDHYLNELNAADKQLDYISGHLMATTKLVEKNINPATSGAKLISANDSANFTYRGMFHDDDFYTVGYETSQKVMHALKWLIQRQGYLVDSRAFLAWTSRDDNQAVSDTITMLMNPFVVQSMQEQITQQAETAQQSQADTGQQVAQNYNQRLLGRVSQIDVNEPVNILMLDAATTGRMAIVYYDILNSGELKNNIVQWGKFATADIPNTANKHTPSFMDLIRGAYQYGGSGQRINTISKQLLTRMMTAVIHGRELPNDLMRNFAHRLRNPAGYSNVNRGKASGRQAWEIDLRNFVAAQNYQLEVTTAMALDEKVTDRSYLFGRLLAIADSIETMTLRQRTAAGSALSERQTVALRFLTNFIEQPATTWERIWSSVNRSYLNRMGASSQAYYMKKFGEINEVLGLAGMTDEPLSPLVFTGFFDQRVANMTKKTDKADVLDTEEENYE